MQINISVVLILMSSMLITARSSGQVKLYESRAFTIRNDRVIQGTFESVAHSPHSMTSNYRSHYRVPTPREVFFKFSLNGKDNERFPGEDHRIFLESDTGIMVSEVYTFGEADPQMNLLGKASRNPFLDKDVDVTFRCDMRAVLSAFEQKGYFITATGDRIEWNNFRGVYIAGNVIPLTWDFVSLQDNPSFRLSDSDGDGIFEITLTFSHFQQEQFADQSERTWDLTADVSEFPHLESPYVLVDALYNLALEELKQDIREDNTLMAGKKWPGVWTRDISYSILLSLAFLLPEESRNSLMAKVDKLRIIQDTGTGGSWPVSTDRMTWALAAWEIYTVTGDRMWLKQAFDIIRNSAEADLVAVFDAQSGLFHGESSFLDWREQTYPAWMDPKDIYQSFCLGTNAVHYQTYRILTWMAQQAGQSAQNYADIAAGIKKAINDQFWQEERGYYGQYVYGRDFMTLSDKSETLGEALCILFDIAEADRARTITEKMPLAEYGPSCIFPQIPDIPPYHNDGIWPFVTAYWTWAGARVQNSAVVEHGLAALIRAAALFLTNKENFVAGTGDYLGTEINSDRQLWSVAGYLAMIYRVVFGVSFETDKLLFSPFIPEHYKGTWKISQFRYRRAELEITLEGHGSQIESFILDGKRIDQTWISADINGKHSIIIRMADNQFPSHDLNLTQNRFAPVTPRPVLSQKKLEWPGTGEDVYYLIYQNGKVVHQSAQTESERIHTDSVNEYQVQAINRAGMYSFLSEPLQVLPQAAVLIAETEKSHASWQNNFSGFSGSGYVRLTRTENTVVNLSIDIQETALYSINFRYANGSGPINTSNKCAIRSFYIDGSRQGVFVFPQRGTDNWTDWGFSNSIHLTMTKGIHRLQLVFEKPNENMNGEENTAHVDYLRLIRLSPEQKTE